MERNRFGDVALTPRSLLSSVFLAAAVALPARADEALSLVFEETFAHGADRWEPTDPAASTLGKDGDRAVIGPQRGRGVIH